MNRERLHSLLDLILEVRERAMPQAPAEAAAHFRQARREGLLGVKVLVEHALERLEAEEQQRQDGSKAIPLDE